MKAKPKVQWVTLTNDPDMPEVWESAIGAVVRKCAEKWGIQPQDEVDKDLAELYFREAISAGFSSEEAAQYMSEMMT